MTTLWLLQVDDLVLVVGKLKNVPDAGFSLVIHKVGITVLYTLLSSKGKTTSLSAWFIAAAAAVIGG